MPCCVCAHGIVLLLRSTSGTSGTSSSPSPVSDLNRRAFVSCGELCALANLLAGLQLSLALISGQDGHHCGIFVRVAVRRPRTPAKCAVHDPLA